MTDQEAENVAASVLHLLTQRGIDAREWESVAIAQRKELDGLRREKQVLCNMLDPDATGQSLVEAVRTVTGERDESERTTLAMVADYARQSAQIAALHAQIECERDTALARAAAALTGAAGEGV